MDFPSSLSHLGLIHEHSTTLFVVIGIDNSYTIRSCLPGCWSKGNIRGAGAQLAPTLGFIPISPRSCHLVLRCLPSSRRAVANLIALASPTWFASYANILPLRPWEAGT
jgi:hypothetical protein